MPDVVSLIPEITDDDIYWVCSLMGLDSFDEPRRAFLKHGATVDVSACPGSGKTTLIVAKLAILARKWPHRTKGICVLSHTNVAREQIELRLGRTVVGQRLLSYPHFIDTIHGFANRFLALPWLYSNGYPSPTIDNDVTTAYRHGVLDYKEYWTVQGFLLNKFSDFDRLRICDRNLNFDLGGKAFQAQSSSKSYQFAQRAIEAAAQAGYFCHDEMFVWADALLEDHVDVPVWLAHRFPLVILDEMQDTFERQASFLYGVFPRSAESVVVQRVGDANQEIFDLPDAGTAQAEPFPDPDEARCLGIPNSFRFGPDIAHLASPFAVQPVGTDGLAGIGPKGPGNPIEEGGHAIFIFPNGSTDGVIEAYAKHALSVLGPELASQGLVTAVGHIHRKDPAVQPGHAHYPKSVGDYWESYAVEISRKDPYPGTLAQYIRAGQALVTDGRVMSPGVEKIASGVLELARRVGDIGELRRTTRSHRAIVQALEENLEALAAYRSLLRLFVAERTPLSKDGWPSHRDDFSAVAQALCSGDINAGRAEKFLSWPDDDASLSASGTGPSHDAGPNIFRVGGTDGTIDVRLGSIHSVKGQTHLATLLLSTYWHDHSAERMMPWLLGAKANGKGVATRDTQRLLHSYVAMTRPSHLLCLAVRRSALGGDKLVDENIETLNGRGWRVAEIIDGEPQWRD